MVVRNSNRPMIPGLNIYYMTSFFRHPGLFWLFYPHLYQTSLFVVPATLWETYRWCPFTENQQFSLFSLMSPNFCSHFFHSYFSFSPYYDLNGPQKFLDCKRKLGPSSAKLTISGDVVCQWRENYQDSNQHIFWKAVTVRIFFLDCFICFVHSVSLPEACEIVEFYSSREKMWIILALRCRSLCRLLGYLNWHDS